jgi:hypothetical protein
MNLIYLRYSPNVAAIPPPPLNHTVRVKELLSCLIAPFQNIEALEWRRDTHITELNHSMKHLCLVSLYDAINSTWNEADFCSTFLNFSQIHKPMYCALLYHEVRHENEPVCPTVYKLTTLSTRFLSFCTPSNMLTKRCWQSDPPTFPDYPKNVFFHHWWLPL